MRYLSIGVCVGGQSCAYLWHALLRSTYVPVPVTLLERPARLRYGHTSAPTINVLDLTTLIWLWLTSRTSFPWQLGRQTPRKAIIFRIFTRPYYCIIWQEAYSYTPDRRLLSLPLSLSLIPPSSITPSFSSFS